MKNRFYYGLVVVIWSLYAYLTYAAPAANTSSRLGLSETGLDLLRLTFLIPYLFMWLLGVYSFSHILSYAKIIKGSPDSKGIAWIGYGIAIVTSGMILTSMVSAFRSMNNSDVSIQVGATVVNNYINVLLPLVAFYLIYAGSASLIKSTQTAGVSVSQKIISLILLVPVLVLYWWLIFSNPDRQAAHSAGVTASYYIPDILIITTLFVPAVVAWGLGILGVVNIWHYMDQVKGAIYKKSLKFAAYGITAIICGSIIIQVLTSIGSSRLLGLGLGPILVVIYFFLLVQAVGFFLVARSATKLTQIETVTAEK